MARVTTSTRVAKKARKSVSRPKTGALLLHHLALTEPQHAVDYEMVSDLLLDAGLAQEHC
jgi:hypothetical protein